MFWHPMMVRHDHEHFLEFNIPSQKRTIYYVNNKYFLLFPELKFKVPYRKSFFNDGNVLLDTPHFVLRYVYRGAEYIPVLPNMAIEDETIYNCLNADLYYQAKSKTFKSKDDLKKFVVNSFFNDKFAGGIQPTLFPRWIHPINLFNHWRLYTNKNNVLTRDFIETIARCV